jgi:hypothetical protein
VVGTGVVGTGVVGTGVVGTGVVGTGVVGTGVVGAAVVGAGRVGVGLEAGCVGFAVVLPGFGDDFPGLPTDAGVVDPGCTGTVATTGARHDTV